MKRDAIRDAGLRELGAYERLRKISADENGSPRPYEERCRLFEEYKVELKKHRREVSLECHPDRNLGATEEEQKEKSARFNRVTRAVNFILNEIKPRPPRPQTFQTQMRIFGAQVPDSAPIVFINLGNMRMGVQDLRYGSGNQTTTSSGGYWPWS